MADCIRVPLLLLLMCILSSVHPIRGDHVGADIIAANAEKLQNLAGGPAPAALNPAAAERNPGAGASLPRRRSAGWKLAEEAVCREDLTRLCPKHSWNNNLAVLECLQDKKEVNQRDGVLWSQGKRQGVPAERAR
ncbi:Golgi apparatus protein 1-like isoform X1 [Lates japonicus]|uniref:Golgi apparatus protein 1-like isoform X1 n=1 Tax=Lates japonicus TaxID=270547 RepID=A0AAD3MXY6_LATJO|nr:Golgi apparatus protein 1-like isoform X1 [Lates japonicus]